MGDLIRRSRCAQLRRPVAHDATSCVRWAANLSQKLDNSRIPTWIKPTGLSTRFAAASKDSAEDPIDEGYSDDTVFISSRRRR